MVKDHERGTNELEVYYILAANNVNRAVLGVEFWASVQLYSL